ncbi:MAG TPA: trypsin-like peptidase domain-containing protein [Polyangiaceae bacterium]|nr:trypsin-like peptidase domain-containing protein [Polyangiaceae bacterium]
MLRPGAPILPALIAVLLAACSGAQNGDAKSRPGDGAGERAKASDDPKRSLTPAEIAAQSLPAIVSVHTPEGMGTGFVVRQDGWIVTDLHVVAGAREVFVTLPNKKSFPVVEVVNASARHDLVVLRIDAQKLPVLKLGKSDAVRAGDPVVAIGHPLGLEDTVSNGLVSAVRELDDLTVLQISAPIAPGSSGGPLFNDHGEVIGVAMAILRGGQNLNLGLPAKYVQDLVLHPDPLPLPKFVEVLSAMAASAHHAPEPERHIPHHATTIFTGCNEVSVYLISQGISDAVSIGAPLYNQGNVTGCYHVYDGAAADMERRLPKSCKGPKRALSDGRDRAAKLNDPSAQAWALRDAFDGLLDAIGRKAAGEP